MSKNTSEQILIVDDDQAIRWTLREALESWGFTPLEAGSVAEAAQRY
jgi:DNA-binding NtrC family response regulator